MYSQMREVDSDLHLLNQRMKLLVGNGMQGVLDIATDISQCCPEDDLLKATTRDLMMEFVTMEKEIEQQVAALEHLKRMSDNIDDPIKSFDEKLAQLEADHNSSSSNHPKIDEMETKMQAQVNEITEEEFDSLKATLLGFTEEDDIALTQTEVNIKCPYSQQEIVNPVRNKACGHTYDKEPILEYIRSRKGQAKCPVVGCSNRQLMKPNLLEDNSDMKKYISELNRRKKAGSAR